MKGITEVHDATNFTQYEICLNIEIQHLEMFHDKCMCIKTKHISITKMFHHSPAGPHASLCNLGQVNGSSSSVFSCCKNHIKPQKTIRPSLGLPFYQASKVGVGVFSGCYVPS